MRYYNASTRQNPGHLLLNEQVVDKADHFYSIYKHQAKANYEEACAYNCTGAVTWYKDGVLYVARSIGSFEWKPLMPGKQAEDMGINWSDKYFCTYEEAIAWSPKTRHDEPRYNELGDVWYVHYHLYAD